MQPADNSGKNIINVKDDLTRDHLIGLSQFIMKAFNSNKNVPNVMGPNDIANFMISFHHALIVLKKKYQIQVTPLLEYT